MKNDTVAQFTLMMLHSVTNAHILHLQTRSYAMHKALQKFYEDIGDITDDFIEAYQGKYEQIAYYEPAFSLAKDPIVYMKGLATKIDSMREDLPQDSELQNIVDEMMQLIDSTLYKLEFLE